MSSKPSPNNNGGGGFGGSKRKAPFDEPRTAKEKKKARLNAATPKPQPVAAPSPSPAPSATSAPAAAGPGPTTGTPRSINLEEFINARAYEINAMEQALTQATEFTGNVRVFQSISRGLRRRAASHNIKRLPIRHRERALRERLKDKNPQKDVKKPPKRKKPILNRVADFERRQKQFRWLETHVWHAKRFHMTAQWNLKIPLHTNAKSGRSTYRFAKEHCILHDASYLRLVELRGTREGITRVVERMCDPMGCVGDGIGIGSKSFTSGLREGECLLYDFPNGFPARCLGPARFLWDNCEREEREASNVGAGAGGGGDKERPRQLWIWIHPGTLDAVLEALNKAVEESTERAKVAVENISGEIVRFSLLGPRSLRVLKSLFDVVPDLTTDQASQIWAKMGHMGGKRAAELLPGSVVALTTHDPRLKFPQRIVKEDTKDDKTADTLVKELKQRWPAPAARSKLWDSEHRTHLVDSKLKEKQLNDRRGKQPLPGTRLEATPEDSRIPVLVIQRSTGSNFPGFDLLLPKSWAMPFWKSLVFLDCKPRALNEIKALTFESGLHYFPDDFVGNQVQASVAQQVASDKQRRWDRTPIGKRANFEDLGNPFPFLPGWNPLVGLDGDAEEGAWTLRSTKLLNHLDRILSRKNLGSRPLLDVISEIRKTFEGLGTTAVSEEQLKKMLVPVRIEMLQGLPQPNAQVFVSDSPDELVVEEKEQVKMDTDDTSDDSNQQGDGTKEKGALDLLVDVFTKQEQHKLRTKPPVSSTGGQELIGYLTSAGYALSSGKGRGIGSVSLVGLIEVRRRKGGMVLVKNPAGRVGKPGKLELLR